MLKNKNNFEIINSFFHCKAEKFSEHPRNRHIFRYSDSSNKMHGREGGEQFCNSYRKTASQNNLHIFKVQKRTNDVICCNITQYISLCLKYDNLRTNSYKVQTNVNLSSLNSHIFWSRST
jgi:hypothetical protein